ncbi:MAG: ATP-binding protein [Anaeromyxobacteraceae bacterium]|nr:ATP-binding protein [Anaeromyxobacteraceae bacterium]
MARPPSGTARRLFLAFAVLLSIFAASSWFALSNLRQVQGGLQQIKQREEGVRLALELASAVRDQYAHQAHTIILGNTTHLDFYSDAEKRVAQLTSAVKTRVMEADERAWVSDIERSSRILDDIFRRRIVPAVLRHEAEVIQEEHGRAQLVVTEIQERADRLVDRFETSIGNIQGQVKAVEEAAMRWTIFFLAGAPLLAAGIGLSIYRSVARPVAKLSEGAARWAEGRLDARVDIDTSDEFGALARQFNAMARSVKEHQARLVQTEKLAGIGRLAAGVAHEINNPLAVILGYVRLLRRRSEGPLADDLGVVEEEAVRAQEIVEGLLDLSRPLASDPEPVDLASLCGEIVSRLGETGRLDGVSVEVEGAGRVEGHPQKLRQVLLNLVRNAAEAAGGGGKVAIRLASLGPGGAQVVVEDSGPGLTVEARDKIFEPFFTTKPTGTGLGLAVSLGIVQAHGGTLEVDSPPGAGATFTIRLPARPPGRV